MATIKFTTVPSKRLAASITAASSAIQVNNILGWDGNALTSSDFGTKLYAILRNDSNTLMEIMELDPETIASASITVLRRGLKFTGDLTTEVTANKLTWIKNETIVELGTDVPQLLEHVVRTVGDQDVDGVKTFSSFPKKSGSTTPTSSDEFTTKAYVDAVVGGSAAYDQNLIPGTAGETLVAGNLCYFKESDSRWWLADADAFATTDLIQLGFAQGSANAGNAVTILIGGLEKNLTGLTVGKYYLSNTAGAISTTPGTIQKFIGWAISTTRLLFAPNGLGSTLGENLIVDTAGESLSVGDWVYFKTSDQKWWKTDADAVGTTKGIKIGVMQSAASADGVGIIRIGGINRTGTSLTAGSQYYISGTAGTISTTVGANMRFVGWALSTNELLMATDSVYGVDQDGSTLYAADSVGTDSYAVTLTPTPPAYFTGMVVRFKAGTANTGACTLNVNSLGAKTIKKNVSDDMATGDILQNQIVEVIYDGTNFQIISPLTVATTYKNGVTTKNISDADTTQTIAHGLGAAPKRVRFWATSDTGTSGAVHTAFGSYDSGGQSGIFSGANNAIKRGGNSATKALTLISDATNNAYNEGTVSVDSTNISIAWVKTNAPGSQTFQIHWEAEG